MSKAWVTEPSRIRLILAIAAASGVTTVKSLPYATDAGALVMVGRAPAKR